MKLVRNKAEIYKLLERDHTLRGGIVVGIDGHIIEIQARAIGVLEDRYGDIYTEPYTRVTTISGRH